MTNEEIITHLDEILADLADEHYEAHQTKVGYKTLKSLPRAGTPWSNYDVSHDAATIKIESLKQALNSDKIS